LQIEDCHATDHEGGLAAACALSVSQKIIKKKKKPASLGKSISIPNRDPSPRPRQLTSERSLRHTSAFCDQVPSVDDTSMMAYTVRHIKPSALGSAAASDYHGDLLDAP
jgi:hypothetical protein